MLLLLIVDSILLIEYYIRSCCCYSRFDPAANCTFNLAIAFNRFDPDISRFDPATMLLRNDSANTWSRGIIFDPDSILICFRRIFDPTSILICSRFLPSAILNKRMKYSCHQGTTFRQYKEEFLSCPRDVFFCDFLEERAEDTSCTEKNYVENYVEKSKKRKNFVTLKLVFKNLFQK